MSKKHFFCRGVRIYVTKKNSADCGPYDVLELCLEVGKAHVKREVFEIELFLVEKVRVRVDYVSARYASRVARSTISRTDAAHFFF